MLVIDTPMDREEINKILDKHLSENKGYLQALDVARKNSSGKIWLIGSGVYKTLLNLLYEQNHTVKDWDFIAEKVFFPLELTDGWTAEKTKHGNPKLIKDDFVIDLVDLNNVHSIKERNLGPEIGHFLSGTPLTIQSVAFDIEEKVVLGEAGIGSILTKTVGVNNRVEYDYAVSIYGDKHSVSRYAEMFGFAALD